MFINEKILKRLMAKAEKREGLYMRRKEGWYEISSGYWQAVIAVGHIPNELLAAMVEFAGAIPQEAECWTVTKEEVQMELAEVNKWIPVPERRFQGELEETPICLMTAGRTPYRVFQFTKHKSIITILEEWAMVPDPGRVDRPNRETQIAGPMYDGNAGIFWKTNFATWRVMKGGPGRCDSIREILKKGTLCYDEEKTD